MVRSDQEMDGSTVHAPIALFPSPYPKSCFELAKALQPLFNHLVDAVARDDEFLMEIMSKYAYIYFNEIKPNQIISSRWLYGPFISDLFRTKTFKKSSIGLVWTSPIRLSSSSDGD